MVRLAALVYLGFASFSQADCRQALAIGLDVSGSVDAREYRLQLDGLAAALQDAEVGAALLVMPTAPVSLAIYEWSGPEDQHLIAGWTAISHQDVLNRLTAGLLATKRTIRTPSTAIGSSMVYGASLLMQQPKCWRHTLDLSGDGTSNSGPRPRDVKAHRMMQNITINALVINTAVETAKTAATDRLTDYYRSEVIIGPASFAEQAAGFENFKATMVRKLLRELQGMTVSHLQSHLQFGTQRSFNKYNGSGRSNNVPSGAGMY